MNAGFLEGESTARVEKRYLGSCSVPFTTLFHEGRIEGVFRMDTPTLNFGYDHTSSFATRRKVDEGTMFVQVLCEHVSARFVSSNTLI